MGFNTEKNKIQKTWEFSIENHIQINEIKEESDKTNDRINEVNITLSIIKRIEDASQDFTLLEKVRVGHMQKTNTNSDDVLFISWDIDLGILDENILPFIKSEAILKLPANQDPQSDPFLMPGEMSTYFSINPPTSTVDPTLTEESPLKNITLHSYLEYNVFGNYLNEFNPGNYEARLIVSIFNPQHLR